jgi:predicted dehydrogenase
VIENKSELTIACVGAGYFSRFHYEAWSRIPNVTVVGSMDQNLPSAADTGYKAFDDLHTMLQTTNPDVLDIITPPPTHLNFIQEAVKHGVKTLICQKPFCTSLEEAREATELCANAKTSLIIHENFRFQPWYRCMHAAIQSDSIGTIHQITFRLRTGDGQGKDAYLDRQPYFQTMPKLLIHETGVHWIDTFRYLLGDPISVYADLRKLNPVIAGEDAGFVLFEFESGKRALFDGNRLLDHAAENHRMTLGECLVEGTEGSLRLFGNGQVNHRAFGKQDETVLLPAEDWPGFGGDCVFNLQQHVVDALLNGTAYENQAADYLAVLEIEQAIYLSAAEHRRIDLVSNEL